MKYLLILPAIAVLVAASGCTMPFGGGVTAGGNGLVIESFEPDFPQIYSTESVQLSLKVRNAGSVDGEITKVELTGIDWTSGGVGLGGASGCSPSILGRILPAVPDKGITGETKNCIWQVKPKANQVPEDLSVTFYPVARVTYKYSTTTVKSITLGSSSELRSIQDRGGTLPADTLSTTSGPVSIDIVSKGPIRVSDAGVQFPIEIKLTNVGGGIVSTSDSNTDWNKLELTIDTGDGLTPTGGTCSSNTYTLWRGKDNTIGCTLSVSGIGSLSRVQKLITVTADYLYIIDKTTSVTVTGQQSNGY